MALVYVGSLPLGLPPPLGLVPSVWLSIGTACCGLSASLQGNLALNASLTATPPTVALELEASAEFSANLDLALLTIPPVLNVSFDVSACASLTADINLSLSLYLPELLLLLSANAGIYSYTYEGTGNSIGAAVTAELATSWPDGAPTSANCTTLIFGAATPISQSTIAAFLNGLSFATGLVYSGKLGISALSPVTKLASAQAAAALSAQLAAAAALSASANANLTVLPPTFAAMISAQAKFYANLKAVAAIAPPQFALSATASAAASLSANFGASCQLGLALSRFDATFFVYTYSGPANAMGAALTSALASHWGDGATPTSGACTATILSATDALSIATLGGFFNGA